MQIVHGDIVICDYELGTGASPMELALYTEGVRAVPRVLLEEIAPLGVVRRTGVIDIPVVQFDAVRDRFTRKIWTVAGAHQIQHRLEAGVAILEALAAEVEAWTDATSVEPETLLAYHRALVDLMAFHVLNWWLPLTEYETLLVELLGPRRGKSCLFDLLSPSRPPHMIDFHQEIMAAERDDPATAAHLSRKLGFLQTWGVDASPLEDPAAMRRHMDLLDAAAAAANLTTLRAARDAARRRRDAAVSEALLAARHDTATFDRVEAVALVCQLACDEEEERRVHQLRGLRNLRCLAGFAGVPHREMTIEMLRREIGA